MKLKTNINDFSSGIISLIISQILIKVFGVIYNIYITNKTGFGDEGNAIYMSGYQIYALLLTVSSIGVPNAISKLISEKISLKDYTNSNRIFKLSLFLFAIVGLFGCISLFVFSGFISKEILEIPEAKLSLMVLSPAIFFVTLNSVIKGFFNGINKIKITAKSQFLEQLIKAFLTVFFVEIIGKISKNNTELMAASANLATTIATLISLIYMCIEYLKNTDKNKIGYNYKRERILVLIRRILKISVPMTLNAILSSLGKNIDSITVVRFLKKKLGEELAIKKYGIISSKIDILISMPLSFNSSIATAVIPEIAKNKSKNDLNGMIKKIEFSLLITLIISIPYAFGCLFFSKEILEILFPKANEGALLLQIASLGIVFSMLTQTINSILQGLGKNNIPMYASLVGVIVKIFSNIILIPIYGIYEKGAIIGNVFSSIVSFIIVYRELVKTIILKKKIFILSIKPITLSIFMIVISKMVYKFLKIYILNIRICGLISIGIAVIIYILGVFVMKMIQKNDIFESVENTGVADLRNTKNLKNKGKIKKK